MEKSINNDTVYEFLKLLVELGGVNYIDKDQVIHSSATDAPIGVVLSKDAQPKPVALFKNGSSVNNNVVFLNPLVENLAKHPEREWFFNHLCVFPGSMLKYTLSCIVEAATSKKKDVDYAAMDVVTQFMDKIDTKMLTEIDRIKAAEWGYIFYDNKDHVAQLQSDIFNEELEKKLKGKVRKASWDVFRGFMASIFGTDRIEENFTYTATMIGLPKADAVFHVLISAVSKMSSTVKKATDIDLHPTLLKNHLQNLEPYHKLWAWFTTGTAQQSVDKAKPASNVPWKSSAVPGGSGVPTNGVSSGVPKNACGAGIIINPLMDPNNATPNTTASGVPLPSSNASFNGSPVPMPTYGNIIVNPMMTPPIPTMGGMNCSSSGVPMNGRGPLG